MKEKIITKATELFLSIGFKSVTMDDLAQSMGISKKQYINTLKIKIS
jgi:AcrR family transcriptional regulator